MKKVLVFIFSICLLLTTAAADTLPIYHANMGLNPPYEVVEVLEYFPFDDDTATMRIDYLGIRQGDCMVLRVGGLTMLIDGGEGWRVNNVIKYLEEHEITGFDVMFLTHAHDDHLEMQEELIKHGYTVGKVISPYSAEDRNTLWRNYKSLLERYGIPYETIQNGDVMEFGGATLTFYHWDESSQTVNNRSVVTMLQYGDARMLLLADIGRAAQEWLLKNYDYTLFKCDIYKAAHHGRTAPMTEFYASMDAGLCIITNTKSSTEVHDKFLDRQDMPRYYISNGTVCTETDGMQWFVWLEALE